jgi:hypothetical protein
LAGGITPVEARGPFYEPVPWFCPEFTDTTLVFSLGIETVSSPRTATLMQAGLAPWRFGPLRIAATWNFAAVRSDDGQAYGFGDPHLYARFRVAGNDSSTWRFWIDGNARIPTAQDKLVPFAWGGQEVETGGTVTRVRRWAVTAGVWYSWTEPGKGDAVTRADLPHALRSAFAVRIPYGDWVPHARFDQVWMKDESERTWFEAGITRLQPRGIHVTLLAGAEFGTREVRAADSWLHLRFATRIR